VHSKLIDIISDKEKSMKGMKWIEDELKKSQIVNQSLEEDLLAKTQKIDRLRIEKQVIIEDNKRATEKELFAKDLQCEEDKKGLKVSL
jgi:hypothetical protein